MKKEKGMIKISLIFLLLVSNIYGADIPNIGDVLKEVTPPKIDRKKNEIPSITIENEDQRIFKDGKKILIKGFTIFDAKHMDNEELKKIVKPYENKELSFKEIQEIVALITKKYKEEGFLVARAYLPSQNLKEQNYILKIGVIEGQYDKLKLNNNSLVKDSIIQENLDYAKKIDEGIISRRSLESVLSVVNNTPGIRILNSRIEPGELVGTSNIVIDTQAEERFSGYVVFDNYGSIYTGKNRLMFGANINSPFNIGDKISIAGLSSKDKGLLNGSLSYAFPLYKNGLRAEISYSKTTYELGDLYEDLDAVGESESLSAIITYPLIASNSDTLNSYFKTSYNKMTDEIQSTFSNIEKSSLTATFGLDYSNKMLLFEKYTSFELDTFFTIGNLKFENAQEKLNDEMGANTNRKFTKINIELQQNTLLTDKLNWKNKISFQHAFGNKNLDGSEDLSIGGVNGVKLYPSGEESAENGYVFNSELIYSLPSFRNINSSVGIFYDLARVYMSRDITNEENRTFQDAGFSYSLNYDKFFINSYLAYRVGSTDIESEKDRDSKFMVQIGFVF
ncbi:ShlB/FhaC/HecB family hemolysin secretion/activation protein [Campylobacterota bacterium DY0563]